MGQRLCALAAASPEAKLVAAVEGKGHPKLGQAAAAECELTIADAYTGGADVLIDFSAPEATPDLIDAALNHNTALVIGTTGLTDNVEAQIAEASVTVPVLKASNFSLVVNVLMRLAAQAGRMLGSEYDVELLEAHHRFKRDAPSGTALSIAKAICDATDRSFDDDVRFVRHGGDAEREPGEITVQALRLGDVVGEHTVYFGTLGERLELRHVGGSRDSYAGGALRAAIWLADKPAALYGMSDVLDLET
jgi:4-hydroxy-tetrahydrodipicolinate reductase